MENEVDQLLEINGDEEPKLILYKWRFMQLNIVFWLLFLFGFAQNAFAPVQDIMIALFHTTPLNVNLLAMIITITNIPLSFVSGYALERLGLRKALILFSGIPTLISGWVRYLGRDYFWVVFAGQTIGALGGPFALASSALLSETWFGENERAVATAVSGLAVVIGSVAASIVAPIMFTKSEEQSEETSGFGNWMLLIAIADTVVALSLLLLRTAPPTPPSASAAHEKAHMKHHESFSEMFKRAMTNIHFWMLMLMFGFGYSSINTITTLINQILSPLHYSDNEIGTIGAALGFGVLGAFVFGGIMDQTKKYLLILRCCAVVAGGGFIWFVLSAYLHPDEPNAWMLFAALGILGFFGVPLVPLLIEMGVETLFPMNEGIATGFLWLAANSISLVLILIANFMQEPCEDQINPVTHVVKCVFPPLSMLHAMMFLGAAFALAVAIGVFFNGPMKRLEFEQRAHHH